MEIGTTPNQKSKLTDKDQGRNDEGESDGGQCWCAQIQRDSDKRETSDGDDREESDRS